MDIHLDRGAFGGLVLYPRWIPAFAGMTETTDPTTTANKHRHPCAGRFYPGESRVRVGA
jgi:hypothetical protein